MGFDDPDLQPEPVAAPATQESPEVISKAPDHDTLPAASEKSVVDGMTFGDLVKVLGAGSTPADSDNGELLWYFDDGAILAAQNGVPSDVMHLGDGGRMRWATPPPDSQGQATSIPGESRRQIMSAVSAIEAKPYFRKVLVGSTAGVVLVVLLVALKWYSVVRRHRRAVSGRLFHANDRIPALPWTGNPKAGEELKGDSNGSHLQ